MSKVHSSKEESSDDEDLKTMDDSGEEADGHESESNESMTKEQSDESEQDDASMDDNASSGAEGGDENENIWGELLKNIWEGDEIDITDSDGILNIDKATTEIRKLVNWYLWAAESIQDSDVYKNIQFTTKEMVKLGCGEEEAEDAAWDARKFLVKKKIVDPNFQVEED